MDNYSKLIHKILFKDYGLRKPLTKELIKHKYPNIYNYIVNMFDDSNSFDESIKRYFFLYSSSFDDNIKPLLIHKPLCPTCNKPVQFTFKRAKPFTKFCSNRCSGKHKDTIYKKQKSDRAKHNGILGWNIATEEKIENRKQSLISKYGTYENAIKYIEKRRQEGVYNKYHVHNIMEIDAVKMKRNETIKQRYNVDHILLIPEVQYKRNETIKHLRKITKSKQEDLAYQLILEKFPDVIRQYQDTRYPFLCDFYIPSLDLFIEFQGSHFHNDRPYLSTDIDLKEIDILKQKSNLIKEKYHRDKTQYDAIIYTWTDLDVRKRKIAKKNNLNFLEFFNLNELEEWIKNGS